MGCLPQALSLPSLARRSTADEDKLGLPRTFLQSQGSSTP
jgi:hypothetical protein